MMDTRRDAYSMQEIADLVGVSLDVIKREIAKGNLLSRKIGGRRIIPKEWYQEWLLRKDERKPSVVAPVKVRGASPPKAAGDFASQWAQMQAERRLRETSTDGRKKR
jgi:excisionase family DNA binding protein